MAVPEILSGLTAGMAVFDAEVMGQRKHDNARGSQEDL
jgi:hypothetical protein